MQFVSFVKKKKIDNLESHYFPHVATSETYLKKKKKIGLKSSNVRKMFSCVFQYHLITNYLYQH